MDFLHILGLLPPIGPFDMNNRFTVAAVFGVTAFNMLQFLGERLSMNGLLGDGIIVGSMQILGAVTAIG